MNNIALVLALSCLLVAGVLDIALKRYSSGARSAGVLIFGVGVVWMILHVASMWLRDVDFVFDQPTLIYGAVAAVCVTASNILLIESMARLPVSLASTVYRLNTVPLVLLAVLFLAEDLGWLEVAGVVMAIVAVLVLHQSSGERAGASLAIWLVITACVVRACYGFVTKLGLQQLAHADTMILLAAVGWCIGGPLYALGREQEVRWSGGDVVAYCVVIGVLVFGVVSLITHALIHGDASIVVPISNMGFVAALGIAFLTGMEPLTRRKVIGTACAVSAIVLLGTGTH